MFEFEKRFARRGKRQEDKASEKIFYQKRERQKMKTAEKIFQKLESSVPQNELNTGRERNLKS